ncbi:relaxase/mobilization nuclease domain-containing protein [Limosilactobacillus reuteri]|nr:relaxase/mobilization nuclease domain-containing protein [Limosilactobacillus reuteri]
MSIVKVISSTNAGANLNYLINEKAHNTTLTNHRSLKFSGQNVYGDYANKVNARYLADQYWVVRQRAKNPKKKVQVHHLIFSFSQHEFNPTKQNLLQQARQALKLVNDFLHQLLPSTAQYLEAVQCDSKGKNLHVHVSCNSVLTNGKVLDTNLISVNSRTVTKNKKQVQYLGIRNQFDNYMTKHFEKLTGRKFQPVKENTVNLVNSKAVKIDDRGGYIWKEDLKQRILDAFYNTDNFDDFEAVLEANNGVKIKHRRASIGKDAHGKKVYRDAVTYVFTGDDGASHLARDFAYTKSGGKRGLGLSFTPQAIQHEFKQREKQQDVEETPSIVESTIKPNNNFAQRVELQQTIAKLNDEEEYDNDNKSKQSIWNINAEEIEFEQADTTQAEQQLHEQQETLKRKLNEKRQQNQRQRQQRANTEQSNVKQPKSNARRTNPNYQEPSNIKQSKPKPTTNNTTIKQTSPQHNEGPNL